MEDLARNRLSSELEGFRSRANDLVGLIHVALPNLTVHDVTHLDALWRVASLLAGENYPLNPLEAFVLGGAILLHDSALSFEAYEGGLSGIRASTIWRDTFAIERERNPDAPTSDTESACDFLAMRALHAARAGELAQHPWKSSVDDSDVFLIADPTLRNHVGGLIGQIASSHHWSIEEVRDKLRNQLNPPSGYPSHWSVDAVKIACLLRTADAAHFCQDRAPDFLHALIRRSGISGAHWSAQNRITGPALLGLDQTQRTIVYTSTQDFKETDSKAWWITFDAITVVQNEIVSANELLADRNISGSPRLKIESVAGAGSISQLSEVIRPQGWEPGDVNIHISDIESLVRNLGGEKLYGVTTTEQKLHVVVRELIQNARDSVVARRSLVPDFVGEITIRFFEEGTNQFLQIEDNGVGMSRRVLTKALLDFGSSFWSSDLVKTELPGLRASSYKSVGKFGIGFYSIFMIASAASISSRRWDAGERDIVQLLFPDGLSLRPIVKHGKSMDHHWSCSTVLKIQLRDDCRISDVEAIPVPSGLTGVPDFAAPLSALIASWVAGLDVPVKFSKRSEHHSSQIHGGKPGETPSARSLLEQLSLGEYRGDLASRIQENISAHVDRMRPVGDMKYGFAAIQSSHGRAEAAPGIRSIGGFGRYSSHGNEKFVGYIECEPDSARRGPGKYLAPASVIQNWAKEQVDLFEANHPDDMQRVVFGASLAEFDVDPIDVVRVLALGVQGMFFASMDSLAAIAQKNPILFVESEYSSSFDTYAEVTPVPNYLVIRLLEHGVFSDLARNSNIPKERYSVLGCLHRAIERAGMRMLIQPSTVKFKSAFGSAKVFAISAVAKLC